MKILIQRVKKASVDVDNQEVGCIGEGILVFLGVMCGDGQEEVDYLANKVLEYRIFRDTSGKMNQSVLDIKGEILVVSQFTLAADGRKGRRPSFDRAASPKEAEQLYQSFINTLKLHTKVESGIFGASMLVNIQNDGPATFFIEYTKTI